MRTPRLLGLVALPLLLVSCAESAEQSGSGAGALAEDGQERMDKAKAALEEQGFEDWYAYSLEGSGPSTGQTRLPPDREAVAFSVWCEGADHGPPFSLDGEEQGVMPCSEDGQTYEVVTDFPYAAGQLEIETERGPRSARWAFAVGVTPEENTSVDADN